MNVLETVVRAVWSDCAWDGHHVDFRVVSVNGYVRRVEGECDRCGEAFTAEEPVGELRSHDPPPLL